MLRTLGVVAALAVVLGNTDLAEAAGKRYKPHDPVFIVANKVGPFNSPYPETGVWEVGDVRCAIHYLELRTVSSLSLNLTTRQTQTVSPDTSSSFHVCVQCSGNRVERIVARLGAHWNVVAELAL